MPAPVGSVSSAHIDSPVEQPPTRAATPESASDEAPRAEPPSAKLILNQLRLKNGIELAKKTVADYFDQGKKRKDLTADLRQVGDPVGIALADKIEQQKGADNNSGLLAGFKNLVSKVGPDLRTPKERAKSVHKVLDEHGLSLALQQLGQDENSAREAVAREFTGSLKTIGGESDIHKAKVQRVESARRELGDALRALGKPTEGLEQVGRPVQESKGVRDPALSTGNEDKPFTAAQSRTPASLYTPEEAAEREKEIAASFKPATGAPKPDPFGPPNNEPFTREEVLKRSNR